MAFPEAVTSGIFYDNYATRFHTRATHHQDLHLRTGVWISAASGYAARRSLTEAFARRSATQAPTSSNARIRLRGDGMYAVK